MFKRATKLYKKAMFIITGWALTISMIIFGSAIFAQDLEDAPVDDMGFDQIPQQSVDQLNSSQIAKPANWSYRLFSVSALDFQPLDGQSSLFTKSGIIREKSARQELNGEVTWKPSEWIVTKIDLQGQVSTNLNSSTTLYRKGAQDWLKINEGFLEMRPVESVSILTGKYRNVSTSGIFQNPLDRVNPANNNPGQLTQREGAYQAVATLRFGPRKGNIKDMSLAAAYLPGFFTDIYGLPQSQVQWPKFYENNIPKFLKPGYTGPIPKMPNGVTPNTSKILADSLHKGYYDYDSGWQGGSLRYYANLFSGDLNLVGYYFEKQFQAGLSYGRYFAEWLELHFEGIGYEHTRFPLATWQKDDGGFYRDWIAGAKLEHDTDTGLVVEYMYRRENPEQLPSNLAEKLSLGAALLNPLTKRPLIAPLRQYAAFSLYRRNMKDVYSVTMNVILGLESAEATASIRQDLNIGEHGKVSVLVSKNFGSAETFYGGFMPFEWKFGTEVLLAF